MVVCAVRLDKIRRLSETSIDVLRCLAEALGGGAERIPYGDIANALGLPRSSVKYVMDQMIHDGVVQVVDGDKLSVEKSVFWFEIED